MTQDRTPDATRIPAAWRKTAILPAVSGRGHRDARHARRAGKLCKCGGPAGPSAEDRPFRA